MATETLKISDGTTMAPQPHQPQKSMCRALQGNMREPCAGTAESARLGLPCLWSTGCWHVSGHAGAQEIARVPDVDDATWAEVRSFVEGNPAPWRHSVSPRP